MTILTARRTLLGASAGILAAPALKAQGRFLYINSWGGTWERSARQHLFDPFTAKTGIEIRITSGVNFAKLAAQVRTGNYEYDISTLGGPSLVQAEQSNLTERPTDQTIDRGKLPADGIFANGIGNHAYSTNLAVNTRNIAAGEVKDWKDFWNLQRYPGRRALPRSMQWTFPFALLADGVAKESIYPIDMDRAFRSLDKVKPAIASWWTQGGQAQQLLADGEVQMIGIWHANVLSAKRNGAPVELVWNQFTVDRTYWVVSRGTPRAQMAFEFIQFAVEPERMARFCIDGQYGPFDQRAFNWINEEQTKDMPTNPAYAAGAIEHEPRSIGAIMTAATRRFEAWQIQ